MIKKTILVLLTLCLVICTAACSDSDEDTTSSPSNGVVVNESLTPSKSTPTSSPIETMPISSPASSSAAISAIDLSTAIADIVEKVQPAVVFISAEVETESFFFNSSSTQTTSGSGVIIRSDGYILTNNHVVEGAVTLEVTLPGFADIYEAEIIGTDPLTDLAVIKIDGDDFPTVQFGNASALRPGNLVIALGYPLALEHGTTITLGVVSNTERSFTLDEATFYDVIQTDAAINPGNSGGPLIDLNGNIVGINSVLAGMAQSIGFAVSSNTAEPVYEALIGDGHRVIRPWLGVHLQDVTPALAADADLPRQSGVAIARVEEGSPADQVGLQVRDVITEFEGMEVTEATQLIKELWQYKVGDQVNITYWHGDKEKEVEIILSVERPE
jgi:serine protease Do